MRGWLPIAAFLLAGFSDPVDVPLDISSTLMNLETRSGGRLGVAVVNQNGAVLTSYRGDERFAMCSTFKLPLAAFVLDDTSNGRGSLDDMMPVTPIDMVDFSPYVETQLASGAVQVEAAAKAAVQLSDNTAANLLLKYQGGPRAFTDWLGLQGDNVTRLDRNEPALNSNLPGDVRDTTSPAAMAGLVQHMLLADGGLDTQTHRTLAAWLIGSTTGKDRIRAGLPADWRVGDKTGSCGGEHPAYNDVAIFWTGAGMPYVLAVYLDQPAGDGATANAVIADVARAVAAQVE